MTNASNTTTHYGLSQWAADDLVRREDFNADHAAIDTALHDHDTDITALQGADTAQTAALNAHTARTDNPHSVTAAQTGAYYPGGTDVAIADGGTGAGTEAGALFNLISGLTAGAPAANDLFPYLDNTNSTAKAVSLSNLGAAMGLARIATGTYTGTGLNGAENPTTLTFDFAPKIVFIFNSVYSTANSSYNEAAFLFPGSYEKYFFFATRDSTNDWEEGFNLIRSSYLSTESDGRVIKIYHTSTRTGQMNYGDTVYKYIAIG